MLSRKTEDYLEAILNLIKEKGYARTKDVAAKIGVRPASVTEMLQKLDAKELILYEKYGGVRLTRKGLSLAQKIKKRHDVLEKFLKMILVSEKTAEKDACTLEHHLHFETVKQFSKFVSFVEWFGKTPEFFKHFERFCKTGKLPKCVRK